MDSIRIIDLSIPSPGHRVKDANVGAEVDRMKHASSGTASVTKPLYSRDQASAFFGEINQVRNSIRRWYTMNTSQWGRHRAMNVSGGRLERFREQFVAWKQTLRSAVTRLGDTSQDGEPFTYTVETRDREETITAFTPWELMARVAPYALGDWYDADQYPTWEEFLRLYEMDDFEVISVNPDDLPVSISQEERDRLREEAQSRLYQRMQESSLSLANQLLSLVANMATVLSRENPRIFETLTTNIAELCDNAGALNVANDPAINEVIERARGLTAYRARDLRASAELRQFASHDAREVADTIQNVAARLRGGGTRILDLDSTEDTEESRQRSA
ncbi:MAG: hypothetical protein R3F07_03975 [Opitutaceae bacterium]